MLLLPVVLVLQLASPSPILQKGLLELQRGDVTNARADLEQASKDYPSNAYVWATLAEVYARMHERELGTAAARNAEKDGEGNPVVAHALALYYSHTGDFANAARLEEQYASSPKGSNGAEGRAAAWYLAAGNEAKALALARKVTQDSGDTFELAQLFLRSQQFSDAADLLTAGLQAHPRDAQLTLALGAARYGQRRFDDAITAFLDVIRIDPDVPQSYVFLSRMLDQAGPHLDEITAATSAWARKNPNDAAAQLALAKVLLAKDPASKEAESLLRRSIELDSKNWDSHYELGLLCEQSHRYTEAAEQFKKATSLDNSQAMPHYHLARVYDRLGNPEGAAAERAIHARLVGTTAAQ